MFHMQNGLYNKVYATGLVFYSFNLKFCLVTVDGQVRLYLQLPEVLARAILLDSWEEEIEETL